jgi:hypothetical protein
MEPLELTDAERQMIEILRSTKDDFALTINREGERWHMRLENYDVGNVADGHGSNFDQAWDDILDNRLR